jgi:hypothetical protein
MPIKVKDKEYPIRPTMWALLQFKREKGKNVSELNDTDLEDLLYWTWLCVTSSCKQDGIAFDIPFEEYIEFVQDSPMEMLVSDKIEDVKKKTASH